MKKKMRRLSCSVPWTYREWKQSTDGGWNREEVHTSMEGVVVQRGESYAEDVSKGNFAEGESCGGGL